MGRIPSTLRSCLLVHTALHTQPGSVLGSFPASAPTPRLPRSRSTCRLLALACLHLVLCSPIRRERVKPGAAPGQGGAEARGWDPREGARGLGVGGGAHTGDPASGPPPGRRRRGRTGFPHPYPESKPRRSPGALAGRRKCSVTPVSAPIPPQASRLGEPLDSAWDTGASSSRAAGRSTTSERRGTSSDPRNFPLFTWDRPSDLRTQARAVLGRAPHHGGRPLGRGDLSLCPPAAPWGWRLRRSDGSRVQDFPSRTSGLRGARCTRVWKSGGSPPPLTPS